MILFSLISWLCCMPCNLSLKLALHFLDVVNLCIQSPLESSDQISTLLEVMGRDCLSAQLILCLIPFKLVFDKTWHLCFIKQWLHTLVKVLHWEIFLRWVKCSFKVFGLHNELILTNVSHELVEQKLLHLVGLLVETVLKGQEPSPLDRQNVPEFFELIKSSHHKFIIWEEHLKEYMAFRNFEGFDLNLIGKGLGFKQTTQNVKFDVCCCVVAFLVKSCLGFHDLFLRECHTLGVLRLFFDSTAELLLDQRFWVCYFLESCLVWSMSSLNFITCVMHLHHGIVIVWLLVWTHVIENIRSLLHELLLVICIKRHVWEVVVFSLKLLLSWLNPAWLLSFDNLLRELVAWSDRLFVLPTNILLGAKQGLVLISYRVNSRVVINLLLRDWWEVVIYAHRVGPIWHKFVLSYQVFLIRPISRSESVLN